MSSAKELLQKTETISKSVSELAVQVEESRRENQRNFRSLHDKVDNLAQTLKDIQADLDNQARLAKERFFKTSSQLDRVEGKVKEIKSSVQRVERDLKKSQAHILSMDSDFDAALDAFNVPQEKLENGRLIYPEKDYEKIFGASEFLDSVVGREEIINPGPFRRAKKRLANNEQASPSRSSRFSEVRSSDEDNSVFMAHIIDSQDESGRREKAIARTAIERDKYVDYEIQRAAYKISADCRSLAEASGESRLDGPAVYGVVEKTAKYLEECGWGRRSHDIAVSGLARLANNQQAFQRYAKHQLDSEIEKITQDLREEVAKTDLPRTGFMQFVKEMSPFSNSSYELENGSMKSLFKANNMAHFVKTAIGSFVTKTVDDFKMKDAVDGVMNSLKKVHNYQSAMEELKEYVLANDGHSFSLSNAEKIELANPAMQFNTNSDLSKSIRNKAFAIAFEIKNSDFYDHESKPKIYSESAKKGAQSIIELCAIMGDRSAQDHLSGQLQMHNDVSNSVINRMKRDDLIHWALKQSLSKNKSAGAPENPIHPNRANKFSGDEFSLN